MNLAATLIGAVVGVAAVVGVNVVVGLGWLPLAVVALAVIVSYIVAALTAQSPASEAFRGFLIGVNAGLNALLGMLIFGGLFGPTAGLILGLVAGGADFLTAVVPLAQTGVYQGLLGWLNWIMPMSWLVVGLGALFFLLSLLGHAILTWIFHVEFFRVTGLDVDFATGTFFMRGGWVANLNFRHTAFNMGNFSFVDNQSTNWHIPHEAGHTLNLGAFGALFHLIGAIDENVTGGGANAYSERLAESHVPGTSQANIIHMWVP